jgi:RsiW-degrading membrane proteinase PrsW (M82 family)
MTVIAARPLRAMLSRQLAWIAVLATGSALYAAVLIALLATGNVLFVPSLLLIGAAIVPVAFITFLDGLDRHRLSFTQVAAAALLGGAGGVVIAGSLEYLTATQLGALPTWAVGIIEEAAKLVVPAVILLWRKPRPLDGVVLGVAVGSSFAVLETMGYAFVALLKSGGNLGSVTQLLLVRSVSEPGGHAAWTGLACAALYTIGRSGRRWLGWLRFAIVFAGVALLHSTWDSVAGNTGYLVIGSASFLALMAATWWLRRGHREDPPAVTENIWTSRDALVTP